jgi:hypothetical protein
MSELCRAKTDSWPQLFDCFVTASAGILVYSRFPDHVPFPKASNSSVRDLLKVNHPRENIVMTIRTLLLAAAMKRIAGTVFAVVLCLTVGTIAQDAGAAQSAATKQTPTTEKSASSKVRHVTGKISDDGKNVTADKDNKSYTIDNPDAVKGHEGHEVRLSGHIDASNNSIHVTKLKMAGEKTSKKKAGTMSEQSPK